MITILNSIYFTVLSVLGIMLILFSASAFGEARMAARMGRDIDASASVVMKTMRDTVIAFLVKFISFPSSVFASTCEALSKVVLAPFELMTNIAMAVGRFGMNIFTHLQQGVSTILSSPRLLMDAFVSLLTSLRNSISTITSKSITFIASLPVNIALGIKVFMITVGQEIGKIIRLGGETLLDIISIRTYNLGNDASKWCKGISVRFINSFDSITKNISRRYKSTVLHSRENLAYFLKYCVDGLKDFFVRRQNDL